MDNLNDFQIQDGTGDIQGKNFHVMFHRLKLKRLIKNIFYNFLGYKLSTPKFVIWKQDFL